MRNKIKQLLNKEGGFTLVELLGVIVILGLIVGISIPLIGNVIDGAEGKTTEAQEELVIDAAQMYELGGGTIDETDGVTSKELIDAGYLEAKSVEDGSTTVIYTVTKDDEGQYSVTK
jgi:type II secretory pathway pseudopilin PulG